MLLARLLNACHHFPGFVYAAVRLIEATATIEVDVRAGMLVAHAQGDQHGSGTNRSKPYSVFFCWATYGWDAKLGRPIWVLLFSMTDIERKPDPVLHRRPSPCGQARLSLPRASWVHAGRARYRIGKQSCQPLHGRRSVVVHHSATH
jgi:hypothetical protein